MHRERRIQAVLQRAVDDGQLAGAAAAVWRDGNVQTACAGWRDIDAQLPVERDTIFRIASMTKPITSLAALMLVDEGKIALHDPISDYAPEFSHMRVLKSPEGPLDETENIVRPITFEDLLTHRSGLTYGDFHRGPIARAYREALGGDLDSDVAPDNWIRRLANLPLIAQPGSAMYYGRSTDLLGLLIARIEGSSLGAVFQRRIFGPLGMGDTGFVVPQEKQHRRSAAYGFNETGQLTKRTTWGGAWGDVVVPERPQNMTYESGGQGLWSTIDDYLKFARLFLGDGAVEGVSLLRSETLANMMTNQLTDPQRARPAWLGLNLGRGFGLGVAVVLKTDDKDFLRRGSAGSVSWPGAFGGWWQADPKEGSVFIFLAHNMVDLAQMARGIGLGVWTAVEEFQTAAMAMEREPAAS
jgi:CubicO group peptidase (beta-lactamase class C family)